MRATVIRHALRVSLFLAVALLANLVARSAVAAEPDEGWRVGIAPFFWAGGANGRLSVDKHEVEVNKNFDQLFADLDFAGSLAVEVGRGAWSVVVEGLYVDVSTDEASPRPDGEFAQVDLQDWLVSGVVGWRLFGSSWGFFEALAGARYTDVSVDLAIERSGRSFTPSRDAHWLDPVIGLRGRIWLAEPLFLAYRLDAGGFSVGADLSSVGTAELGYTLGPAELRLGYRYLYLRYDDEDFDYDAVHQGPVLGVGFRL
jgi:hypothetical protein